MAGEVVSLRLARKRRERTARSEAGAQNRAVHGRTKAERTAEAARREAEARRLDGHEVE